MNDLIKKLVEAYGPSGFEDTIRDLIQEEVADYVTEMHTDAMGNLFAYKKGNGDGLKVMIAAHMDEIGVMVTHIREDGFLRFTNIGGVYPANLTGSRVLFANGTIGVVGSEPTGDRHKLNPLSKHYIDVGATSPEDSPVQVGDAGGFYRTFTAQGNRLFAKSIDDRIGCVIAIEALKRLQNSPHDVYFVFTVQEEVGVRGAQVAAQALSPDVGIALDVTIAADTPKSYPMAVGLGKGAAIKVKDSGMIAHHGLVQLMKQRATEANIPYQLEVLPAGSTDARSMQIANAGCAAGCISIPCRYVHTQSETVDANDVEECIKLLVAILENDINL